VATDLEGNGRDMIVRTSQLTAEAIRQVGLRIADELRGLGKKASQEVLELHKTIGEIEQRAKSEIEDLNQQIEQVAQSILEDMTRVADQTDSLLSACKAASDAVVQHRSAIAACTPVASAAPPTKETEQAQAAVERALSEFSEKSSEGNVPMFPKSKRERL
jgi:uncharacterized protein YoxC